VAAKKIRGILGPATTPFDADGNLALADFRTNVRAHLAAGLDGLVVCGSTGEAPLLEEEERRSLVAAAREAIPADKLLIVGCGAESARQTLARCRSVASLGADAALVVGPHYYGDKMTVAALQAYYERVADESPLPVMLYNIPRYMHYRLEPELVQTLARHENIVGMKDSAGDLECLRRYLEAQSDSFNVLTGSGGTLFQALELGVRGGIVSVGLFVPAMTLRVHTLFAAGQKAEASALQARLTPLSMEIVVKMGVAGVKAALDAVGLIGGPLRSPLLPLGPVERGRLEELLQGAR
jgi:4-hydroxy-2-oxoglutarate aldolase